MNPDRKPALHEAHADIPTLIQTLLGTERRLEELTAGEVDAVADREGRTFLLRRAQEQSRHSEAARQVAVLDALPAHITLLDTQGLIISVNAAWRRFAHANAIQGPTLGIGLNYLEICDRARGPDAGEARQAAAGIRAVLAGEAKSFAMEYACHAPWEQRFFLLTVTPLAGDRPNGAVVMHLDITEQRRVKRDLQTATDRLHHVVFENPSVLYAQRIEGSVLTLAWISQNVQRLIGYTLEEALAPDWWAECLHPDERAPVLAELAGLFVSDRLTQEYRFRHRDGRYLWLRDEKRILRDAAGQATEVVGSWSDISVRKGAEQRLLENEKEYRLLFDSNPHPMWVFDAESLAFLAVNEAAVQLYGFSKDEFLSMTIKEIRPKGELPALLAYLPTMPESPSLPATQVKHRKKDGSLIEVAGTSNLIEFHGRRARLVLAQDVSEKKLLEAQLLQSQKMEAVGRLAGGVAHDFNNTLGVILGYTELLMRTAGQPERRKLEQILRATQRASGLTHKLLAFSRKEVVAPRVLDLNGLLSDLEEMLGRLIGEDLDLAIVPGADLGHVKADPGQLEQLVMNLCLNARDAMPDGGLLRIETSNVELGADQVAQDASIAPGRYVMLAVSDTGCGIEKELLTKVFEPFFTTKEPGKGTGLGLAMVYGIVKQAGGHIWLDSEAGRGTTFKIHLPRVDEPGKASELPATPMPSRGWETLLLVEDEAPLRDIAREILVEHGYHVLEAAAAGDAIEVARCHPEPIHLLVTDVVMPGMNGRALAETLVAARPTLRVLYMSGYTNDVLAHNRVLEAGILLLEKPFTTRTLLGRVREALGARGPAENA